MADLIGELIALFLTVLTAGFCLGVMAERVWTQPRPSRNDVDIDVILAQAERPFYKTAP